MPSLYINGVSVTVPDGVTVASAVMLSGQSAFRHSISGEPRAPLCGMGICFECRLIVDGSAHARSCQIVAREGMDVRTT
jgi:aerobic-type carbon monoxide dehydrogenase small subunit (CoxS/CutS family)